MAGVWIIEQRSHTGAKWKPCDQNFLSRASVNGAVRLANVTARGDYEYRAVRYIPATTRKPKR